MEPETAAPEPEAAAQTVPLDDSIKPKNPSVTLNMQAATTALTQSTAQAEVTRLGTLNTLGTNERGGIPPGPAPAPIITSGQNPIVTNGSNAATVPPLMQQYAALQAQSTQQMSQLQQQTMANFNTMASLNPMLLNLVQLNAIKQQQQGFPGTAQQPGTAAQNAALFTNPFNFPFVQASQMPIAQARQPGQSPPAKRQATSSPAQPMMMQNPMMYNAAALQMAMMQQRFHPGMMQFSPNFRPQFGVPGRYGMSNSNQGGMRVQIDKRNKSAYDAGFLAVETNDKAHADEVVKRCEEISRGLQKHLGGAAKDRFGAADSDGEYQQVGFEELKKACGNTARYLKPYQIVGVNFLMLLYRTRIGGAILADEMGLGKTAQLIVYLGAIRSLENDPGPHLVVVPASLLENWQRELRRWCPSLKTVVYYGKHRSVVRKRLADLKERLARGEQVDDDLLDLQDVDLLAEAAASDRLAEAVAADKAFHEKDDDPAGYREALAHESDDEYDLKRDKAKDNGKILPPVEEPPIKWDPNVPLQEAPFNVMLTCYTLFERDSPEQKEDRKFLESWRWSHLIMDEAHALKNRNASRTTRLRRVANLSRRRVMMTGTPLQNDLSELQNLMHFLLPQVFGAQGKFEDFESMLQGDEAETQKLTERMKSLLSPFVLRRLKTEVAGQLTEKKHSTEFINMTPVQEGMYESSVSRVRSQIAAGSKAAAAAAAARANGDEETAEKVAVENFIKQVGAKKINHIFTHLRKIAQHPLLVRHHYDDATVEIIAAKALEREIFGGKVTHKKILDELLTYSDYSLHAFCYNHGPDFFMYRLNSTHLMTSAKFQFLSKLLPKLKAEGSRPLIFSQWTAVLDIIEWLMDELRLPYVRLDGSTAVDERLATVDRFNQSEDVFAFLLSTRAGGQGLNLTGADTVIIHDVDFNPQIDRQAEDRCHRLGQTRPVMVYRLITKSSVDQNIYNLSQRKLKLDRAVLEGITTTSTGKGSRRTAGANAEEKQQMGYILHSLLAGKEDYEQMMVMPDEIEEDEQPDWKKKEFEEKKKKQKAAALAAAANGNAAAGGVGGEVIKEDEKPVMAAPPTAPVVNKIRLKVKMPVPPPAAGTNHAAPPAVAPVANGIVKEALNAVLPEAVKPQDLSAIPALSIEPLVVQQPITNSLPGIAPLDAPAPLAAPVAMETSTIPIVKISIPRAAGLTITNTTTTNPPPAAAKVEEASVQEAPTCDVDMMNAEQGAEQQQVPSSVPSMMSLDTMAVGGGVGVGNKDNADP